MKISIIIPLYNVEKYIIPCLESIFKKTENFNYEVIIVDDCSPDKSVDLINQYVFDNNIENLRLFRNKENKGLSYSRNLGIEKARFEYLWFIDSDDTVNMSALDRFLANSYEADIIQFGADNIDENGYFINNYINLDKGFTENYSTLFITGKVRRLHVVVWNKIIKTELFYSNFNLRFCEGIIHEDELFNLLLCKASNTIIFSDEIIYNYRRHPGGYTSFKLSDKFFTSWKIIFEQAFRLLTDCKKDVFIDWFLEKTAVFLRKYQYTTSQVIRFKRLTNHYFFLYPLSFWKNNWRFKDLEEYFNTSLDVYKIKSNVNNYKVSIIITCHKNPEKLSSAINSVLNQSYKNIEVIIVNDSGTEYDIQEIYNRLPDWLISQIIYIKFLYKVGIGNAINKGIEKATGKYVCFLSDCNNYLEHKIRHGVDILMQYPSNDIWGVYCGYYIEGSSYKNIETKSGNLTYHILKQDYDNYSLRLDTVLIKTEHLKENNLRIDMKLKSLHDSNLFLQLFRHGYVIGHNKCDVIIHPHYNDTLYKNNCTILQNDNRYFFLHHNSDMQLFCNDLRNEIYDHHLRQSSGLPSDNYKLKIQKAFIAGSANYDFSHHETFFLAEQYLDQTNLLNHKLRELGDQITDLNYTSQQLSNTLLEKSNTLLENNNEIITLRSNFVNLLNNYLKLYSELYNCAKIISGKSESYRKLAIAFHSLYSDMCSNPILKKLIPKTILPIIPQTPPQLKIKSPNSSNFTSQETTFAESFYTPSTLRKVSDVRPAIKEKNNSCCLLRYPKNKGESITEGGLRLYGKYKVSEKNKPLVSIITTAKNSLNHIYQTIESVLSQSYDNIEYIVIDGNSTDGTLDIIKAFDWAIDYYISKADIGYYTCINKGVNLATGDYITVLDGENYYTRDAIKNLVSEAISSGADIIAGGGKRLEPKGKVTQTQQVFWDERIHIESTLLHEACLINKNLYNNFGLYNEQYAMIASWVWFLYVYGKCKVSLLDQEILRIHKSWIDSDSAEYDREKFLFLSSKIKHLNYDDFKSIYSRHKFSKKEISTIIKKFSHNLNFSKGLSLFLNNLGKDDKKCLQVR